MAHDRPAERSAPAKRGKTTALGKGADPDDGVVTPEAALCTRPPDQPCGRYRPIESCGELLPAAEQARAAGDDRHRLHQADVRIAQIGIASCRERVCQYV